MESPTSSCDGYRVGVILKDNTTYSPWRQLNARHSLCELTQMWFLQGIAKNFGKKSPNKAQLIDLI